MRTRIFVTGVAAYGETKLFCINAQMDHIPLRINPSSQPHHQSCPFDVNFNSNHLFSTFNTQPFDTHTNSLLNLAHISRSIRSKLILVLLTIHKALQRLHIWEFDRGYSIMFLNDSFRRCSVKSKRCCCGGFRGGGVELLVSLSFIFLESRRERIESDHIVVCCAVFLED